MAGGSTGVLAWDKEDTLHLQELSTLIFFYRTVSIPFNFPSSVHYCHLLFKLSVYIYFGQILFYKIYLWQYLNCCSRFSATTCSLSCSLFSLSNFACSFICTSLSCTFCTSSASTSAKCLLSSASRKSRSLQ